MRDVELAARLRKAAEEIRRRVDERAGGAREKTAAENAAELDPKRVLDFMLFYGR